MEKVDLYSIIIVHYNQPQYIFTAIESVLAQDYDRIEIVIADDGSEHFDIEEIEKFIASKKKSNIEQVTIIHNRTNLGTVKNLNNALIRVKGEYVQFFAADDALYDKTVVSRLQKEIKEMTEETLCVTAQSLMMNEKLNSKISDFTDVLLATDLNSKKAEDQYCALQLSSFYGIGCSVFRTATFFKYEGFDIRYKLVEDWSYFLSQTRKGRKIWFVNFYALMHRDGGVSHSLSENITPTQKQFKEDILQIYENEILPFLRKATLNNQIKLLNEYEAIRLDYGNQYGASVRKPRIDIVRENKKLFLRKIFWWFLSKKEVIFKTNVQRLLPLFVGWVLTGSIGIWFAENGVGIIENDFVKSLLLFLVRWGFPAIIILCFGGIGVAIILFAYEQGKKWFF